MGGWYQDGVTAVVQGSIARDQPVAVDLVQVIGPADVRMRDLLRQAHLVAQLLEGVAGDDDLLERHLADQRLVDRKVDRAHAAVTKHPLDTVAPAEPVGEGIRARLAAGAIVDRGSESKLAALEMCAMKRVSRRCSSSSADTGEEGIRSAHGRRGA